MQKCKDPEDLFAVRETLRSPHSALFFSTSCARANTSHSLDLSKDPKNIKEEMKKILGGKMRIGQPKDRYEREEDRLADSILRAAATITAR